MNGLLKKLFPLSAIVFFCSAFMSVHAADTIELEVNHSSHILYISVDDYPYIAVTPDMIGQKIEITHMFGSGLNNVRVQAFNPSTSSNYGFDLAILKNGSNHISASCTTPNCPSNVPAPTDGHHSRRVYFDNVYSVSLSGNPPKVDLAVQHTDLDSGEEGSIYINDVYTGYSVSDGKQFSLPPGDYTVGVGVHKQEDVPHGAKSLRKYSGRYYEKGVRLNAPSKTIDFASPGYQPLGVQNRIRVGIFPVEKLVHEGQTHTLNQNDIDRLHAQIQKTVEDYIEPLSYGLSTWDVTFEDMITDSPISLTGFNAPQFYINQNIRHAQDEYDIIVTYDARPMSGGAASNGFVRFGKGAVAANEVVGHTNQELPLELLFHEALHVYEQWQQDGRHLWKGIDGIHGAQQAFGYSNDRTLNLNIWGNHSWTKFYADYMRGQVVELNSMSVSSGAPSQPADPSSLDPSSFRYIGAFNVVRQGLGNLHGQPIEGNYTLRNVRDTNSYLVSSGSGQSADILQSPSLPSNSDWYVERYNDEYFRLRVSATNDDYLHVDESDVSNLMVSSIHEHAWSSHWFFDKVSHKSSIYRLRNRWTGLYINVYQDPSSPDLNPSPEILGWSSARWYIEPKEAFVRDSPEKGEYKISNRWWTHTDNVLNLSWMSPGVKKRSLTSIFSNTYWTTEPAPDGNVFFKLGEWSSDSGYLVLAEGVDTDSNTYHYLDIQPSGTGPGAIWKTEQVPGTAADYRIRNIKTNDYLYLHEQYPALRFGAPDNVMSLSRARWEFCSCGPNGQLEIENIFYAGEYLLNVSRGRPSIGHHTNDSHPNAAPNNWVLERMGDFYRIRQDENQYLHISDDGRSVHVSGISPTAWRSQWRVVASNGGYRLQNRWNGRFLYVDRDDYGNPILGARGAMHASIHDWAGIWNFEHIN